MPRVAVNFLGALCDDIGIRTRDVPLRGDMSMRCPHVNNVR